MHGYVLADDLLLEAQRDIVLIVPLLDFADQIFLHLGFSVVGIGKIFNFILFRIDERICNTP